jgi:hypothetical protein
MAREVEHRRHLFTDCSGFHYRDSEEVRRSRTFPFLRDCTCGTCKDRILKVLRDKDWNHLNVDVEQILDHIMKSIRARSGNL